ncbi:UNVERIFIED_CONTAM: hypothetical protein Sradi_4659800 [Sesamum radiatum]|uniref:Uncharacterized protein n=1 Tax=Sesamum radiatum TaxID=300843 RepID=A0AAW2MUK3_SESRA
MDWAARWAACWACGPQLGWALLFAGPLAVAGLMSLGCSAGLLAGLLSGLGEKAWAGREGDGALGLALGRESRPPMGWAGRECWATG